MARFSFCRRVPHRRRRPALHRPAVNAFSAIQAFDELVLRAAHGSPGALVPLFVAATVIGGGWGLFGLIPFLVRPATRTLTLWLFGAITLTSGLVSLIKWLVGRVRPCDALDWCGSLVFRSPGGHSFPSGHAAGAFAFASFVAWIAPRHAPWLLAFAVIVAWSRCVLGVHYPSDVIVGSILGATIGSLMAWRARRALRSDRAT